MGASWRPGAAALLLVLAAALLPPSTLAGTAADPELTDPAGDQAVDPGTVPLVPGVNDEPFDDVDVVAAWLEERTGDCVGAVDAACPSVTLVVQTTAGWSTGTMTIGFTVKRGPTSLPASTATEAGRPFTLLLNGTAVAGLDNATAANGADGLRISLPLPQLGAVGGDLLTDLAITTTRTDPGLLQGVAEDDQTGTDTSGPGRDYTFVRSPVNPRLLLDLVSIDGQPGSTRTVTQSDATIEVALRITNLGLDDDGWQMALNSNVPLENPPTFIQAFTPIGAGATADTTVPVSLAGMAEGRISLIFSVTSERGAIDTARATLDYDLPAAPPPPPGQREVKPAGLTFLTGAAEAAGFDGPFGPYAELVLLALIILLVLLAIFLLLALGRTTLDDEPASEAPWPVEAPARRGRAGPAGIQETVRAGEAPPALFPDQPPAAEPEPELDAAALAAALAPEPEPVPAAAPVPTASAGARVRIEEVRHTPREPDAGQAVTTEVLLRNEGSAATLRIALSIDGKPTAERVVQVPSRATKAVELPWTAGPGDNRVRIQAFPA